MNTQDMQVTVRVKDMPVVRKMARALASCMLGLEKIASPDTDCLKKRRIASGVLAKLRRTQW